MRIAWEEPFGPVIPVVRVASVEQAIDHCNTNNLALQARSRAENVFREKTAPWLLLEQGVEVRLMGYSWSQGCVFTQDINQAIYISDAMETGTVQVNAAPARGPDHFPFQCAFVGATSLRTCLLAASVARNALVITLC